MCCVGNDHDLRAVTIGAAHQVIPAFGGFFKMTMDAGVGTFSGRIQLNAGVGRVSFGGVLLPKADPQSEDAADALAIAVCHAHHRRSVVLKVAG